MSLNPAQRDAVDTLSGPLLVLAGAGTGKTRVVTYRIANLIRNRVRPERILAVTFTNKAAGEMRERADEILSSIPSSYGNQTRNHVQGSSKYGGRSSSKRDKPRPEISTFHSLCVRILRRQIQHLGYPQQFVILDRGDQEGGCPAGVARDSSTDGNATAGRFAVLHWSMENGRTESARRARSRRATRRSSSQRSDIGAIKMRLKRPASVDFDDLLLLTQELFSRFPETRRTEAARFDHLLIDEYQDTNASQYRIVQSLAAEHRNLVRCR